MPASSSSMGKTAVPYMPKVSTKPYFSAISAAEAISSLHVSSPSPRFSSVKAPSPELNKSAQCHSACQENKPPVRIVTYNLT